MDKLAYRLQDLTALGLGGRTHLYNEISAGRLVARKSGGRTVVLHEDLDAYLKSMAPAPIAPRQAGDGKAA